MKLNALEMSKLKPNDVKNLILSNTEIEVCFFGQPKFLITKKKVEAKKEITLTDLCRTSKPMLHAALKKCKTMKIVAGKGVVVGFLVMVK